MLLIFFLFKIAVALKFSCGYTVCHFLNASLSYTCVSVSGFTGEKGIQGLRGIKGSVGGEGVQGEKGDIGPAGPKGMVAYLIIISTC